MSGRKDAQQVVFKWVTETNPNANFSEVTRLYENLSNSIEGQREGFFEEEKILADIKREHDRVLKRFPSSVFLSILGRESLVYSPISSDRTDEVFKMGQDNSVKVF